MGRNRSSAFGLVTLMHFQQVIENVERVHQCPHLCRFILFVQFYDLRVDRLLRYLDAFWKDCLVHFKYGSFV
jgi:hypothetical protein